MLNPILSSTAMRRMRSLQFPVILLAYGSVMLALTWIGLMPYTGIFTIQSLGRGLVVYGFLLIVQCVLLVLIAPALTSASIAGERERQTLEMLLVTRTGAFRIVMGKLLESTLSLILVVLAGLPSMCLCLLYGALTLEQLLLAVLFLIALSFACGAAGILASSVCRTTVGATIISYVMLVILGLVLCLPAVLGYSRRVTDVIYDAQQYQALTWQGALSLFSPLFYLNPGIGLTSLLLDQTNLLTSQFEWRGWGRILATYKLMNAVGLTRVVLFNVCGLGLLGFVFSCLAALRVKKHPGKKKGTGK